ncbi:hypothetical protein [Kitasatospora sp. GAS204B]|uniref:hypothetical protein n=1 Tax=unclassified Kitasatospora TaxID=2633591 RepID=UPI002475D9F9|nr:hypothetical protein [Kitasatospora sp. GAS204B]MDH6122968.1 hypothetical protein [Kitasatospora sp. GAS204B]
MDGQEPLTLEKVVPVAVRTAERGDRDCDHVGPVFRVPGLKLSDRCAEHAAAAAGCPVSALDPVHLDDEDREYIAELLEERRTDAVFYAVDDWQGVQYWDHRHDTPTAFADWARDTYNGTAESMDIPALYCRSPSGRVHGRYLRRLSDAAISGTRVVIELLIRRFRCLNAACAAVRFAEQVTGWSAEDLAGGAALATEIGAFGAGGRAGYGPAPQDPQRWYWQGDTP